MRHVPKFAWMVLFALVTLRCSGAHVFAKASIGAMKKGHADHKAAGVVLWLTPIENAGMRPEPRQFILTQKDRQFHPHMLVVPTGSTVAFPNLDPFLHNVFSMFNGKRFDLGMYDAKTHRVVKFDREGVSFVFCNIHPEMGAIVLTLSTPYYAVSDANGTLVMRDVPPGKYRLSVWAEDVDSGMLEARSRIMEVPEAGDLQLGEIALDRTSDAMRNHKNKFGEAYAPAPKDPY